MQWKNSNVKFTILVLILVFFSPIIMWSSRLVINIKREFTQEELKIIIDEYHLSSEARVEYLFSQGGDLYGVKIKLTDNQNIKDIFDCEFAYYNENEFEQEFTYYSSSGKVNAISLSECIEEINALFHEQFIGLYYFEEDSDRYLEITKQYAKNIKIYQ